MSSGPTQALWGIRREVLVPISLDIDIDGVRVVDTLAWDCHQSELSPEEFSRRMTEELGLSRSFIRPIAQSISRQLIDYGRRLPGWVAEGMVAPAAENLQVIDIDVRFRSVVYRDRLEWDVNCLHSSPESFARSTVADLALPQEMEPAIAFTIHQQICKHRVEMTPSTSGNKGNTPEDVMGPRLSSLQPVDQYEFNAQDWKDHRPATTKH